MKINKKEKLCNENQMRNIQIFIKKICRKKFVVFIIANKIDIMINENKSIKKI